MLNPTCAIACAALLLPILAAPAQTPPPAAAVPTFTLADVHPSPHRSDNYMRGGQLRGGRYILRGATMVDLVANAWDVDPLNVLSGPAWLELDRFDIDATAPRATTPDDLRLMLRALLVSRFHLVVHTDVKPQPAYVLTVAKAAPKMKPSDSSEDTRCQYQPPPQSTGPPSPTQPIAFACHNQSMAALADFLHQVASPYLSRPVVDATNLKSSYDFNLQWSWQPPRGDADGITIFNAVDSQLGLKLEMKTAPLPVVVVESVDRKPTPNPAEVAHDLPPHPPAQFDVAVIRPQAPKEKHFGIAIDGSGKISLQHASVETLIAFAWDIDKEMIVRGQYVIDQTFYDVVGKAATDPSATAPGSAPLVDIDDLREMLRTLLAERFNLKVHTEVRPFDALTLLPGTPKMKKADPTARSSCKAGPGPDGKDPRLTNPALTRLVSCQNTTMDELAAQFHDLAPGNIKTPVLNNTNLPGGYDFALYWSGENDGPTPAPAPSADNSLPSDPSAAIPLTEAVSKQLGLKLEKVNRPVPMLVIDHLDDKPTDN